MEVIFNVAVLWVVTACSIVGGCRHFGRTYCLRLQGRKVLFQVQVYLYRQVTRKKPKVREKRKQHDMNQGRNERKGPCRPLWPL
jgi:hypothetical protein